MDIPNWTFVRQIAIKSSSCGLIASIAAGFIWSISTGASALAGAAIGTLNLLAIAKISWAIIQGKTEKKSVAFWASLFFVKLLLLFGLTFAAIGLLGANPVAFCLGFTAFLAGILWEGTSFWLRKNYSKTVD